jgi:hypothetical protein
VERPGTWALNGLLAVAALAFVLLAAFTTLTTAASLLSTLFAAIAAVAALFTIRQTRDARVEAARQHREQLEIRRLDEVKRIAALVAEFGEVAGLEGAPEGKQSRLPLIRQQLAVAVNVFTSLQGPQLTACETAADLTATRSPAFPTRAEAQRLVEACFDELDETLEDLSVAAK